MNNTQKVLAIGALVIIAAAYYLYSNNQKPGNYDSFANCLTEKGISMGGTDWCPHCKDQKAMFGNSFRLIDYHNCDNERAWCNEKGIRGYPTWVLPDGRSYAGTQKLETLAAISGCKLVYAE